MHFNNRTVSIVFYLTHIHLANNIYIYIYRHILTHTCAPISLWSPTQICIKMSELPILSPKPLSFKKNADSWKLQFAQCSVFTSLSQTHTLPLPFTHTHYLSPPTPPLQTHTLPLFLSNRHTLSLSFRHPLRSLSYTHVNTHTHFLNLSLTHSPLS